MYSVHALFSFSLLHTASAPRRPLTLTLLRSRSHASISLEEVVWYCIIALTPPLYMQPPVGAHRSTKAPKAGSRASGLSGASHPAGSAKPSCVFALCLCCLCLSSLAASKAQIGRPVGLLAHELLQAAFVCCTFVQPACCCWLLELKAP